MKNIIKNIAIKLGVIKPEPRYFSHYQYGIKGPNMTATAVFVNNPDYVRFKDTNKGAEVQASEMLAVLRELRTSR